MSDGPEVALLCGLCPTRRVLCYLHPTRRVNAPGFVSLAPGKGRRERRPSVEGNQFHIDFGPPPVPGIGHPLRYRCRLGHPWTIPYTTILAAYATAVEAGRRELVAGIDV